MRIFLDANVLVSIVNQEYPSFHYCARIASLADKPGFTIFTSAWELPGILHVKSMAKP
jgi:hypothetical protein